MSALRIDTESSPLRRHLGPVAWFVLEELALLADGDSVVETNVRDLATRLSLNKDTVARALGRSRSEGLVVNELQTNRAGCFGSGRYQATAVAGVQRLDDETTSPTRSRPSRTPSPVPCLAASTQLSLIDDGPADVDRHPRSESPTTPWNDDALAPGVQGHPAPVPLDAQDSARTRSQPC